MSSAAYCMDATGQTTTSTQIRHGQGLIVESHETRAPLPEIIAVLGKPTGFVDGRD